MTGQRYDPADIMALPPGVSEQDLDWLVISWDIRKPEEHYDSFRHFVVGPGVLYARLGRVDLEVFSNPDHQGPWITEDFRAYTNAYRQAIERTQDKFAQGYEWVCQPFIVDLGAGDNSLRKLFRDERNIETAGDLMLNTNPRYRTAFKSVILKERRIALARQEDAGARRM